MKINLEKGFKQFLIRTGIFVAAFIAFSGIIGLNLFKYGILTDWRFEIYGRVGYILLFSIFGFILVYRKRLTELRIEKFKRKDAIMIGISVVLLVLFSLFEANANLFALNTLNIMLSHILGLSVFVFLVLGIYGWKFIKSFAKKFKKELAYFLVFGIIVYSSMKFVWSLWPYLSLAVLEIVTSLLKILGIEVATFGTAGITVNDFSVIVAEACSGIYSIFIFSALFLFIVFLDWSKINKIKAAVLFVPAVVGAFAFNILRVFVLMLVGAYISANLALGLYHSYSGMIFFLIYFIIFWAVFYKWMKK